MKTSTKQAKTLNLVTIKGVGMIATTSRPQRIIRTCKATAHKVKILQLDKICKEEVVTRHWTDEIDAHCMDYAADLCNVYSKETGDYLGYTTKGKFYWDT